MIFSPPSPGRAVSRANVGSRSDELATSAAGFVHDIRNPLTSLGCAAELLRSGGNVDRDRLLAIIETDVGRLERLVSAFAGRLGRKRATVPDTDAEIDLSKLFPDLLRPLAVQAARVGVEVVSSGFERPMPIRGGEFGLTGALESVIEHVLSLCGAGDMLRIDASLNDGGVRIVVEADRAAPLRRSHGHRRDYRLVRAGRIFEVHRGALRNDFHHRITIDLPLLPDPGCMS